MPLVIFMPETYAPVILKRRAQKLRKDTGNSSIVSPLEVQSRNLREMIIVTISRPFRMMLHESIVSLTSLYLALAYAIFYLYFEAYPIIFQGLSHDSVLFLANFWRITTNSIDCSGIYKMSPGISGLMFLPSKSFPSIPPIPGSDSGLTSPNSRNRCRSRLLRLHLV